jgi:hypothetical protein
MNTASQEVVLMNVQPPSTDWESVLTSAVETALQALMELTPEQPAQWTLEASDRAASVAESRYPEIVN